MRFELVKLRKTLKPTPEEIQARKEGVKNTKGLLQQEIANRLEITRQHYSNLENGLTNPSFELMVKFGEVFKDEYVDMWELWKNEK